MSALHLVHNGTYCTATWLMRRLQWAQSSYIISAPYLSPSNPLLLCHSSFLALFPPPLRRLTHCAVSRVDTEQFQGCCHGKIVEQEPGPQSHQHRSQTQLCSHSLLRQNLAVSVNTAYLSAYFENLKMNYISKLIHTTIFFTLLY